MKAGKKMNVKQFYAKNQFIIENDFEIILKSYKSQVAKIDKKNNILEFGKNWEYSRTTLKYLNYFINDFSYIINNIDYEKFINTKNKKKYLEKLVEIQEIKINKNL